MLPRVFLLLLGWTPLVLVGQDPLPEGLVDPFADGIDPPERSVRIELEVLEVDPVESRALLRNGFGWSDAAPLREAIAGLEESGKARELGKSVVSALDGETVRVGGGREKMIPLEFSGPSVPSVLKGPIESGTDVRSPSAPSAVEWRELGLSLEAQPSIEPDGTHVRLEVNTRHVRHAGDLPFFEGIARQEIPFFHRNQADSELLVRDGQTTLLAVQESVGRTAHLYFFVRARILSERGKAPLDAPGDAVNFGILTEFIALDLADWQRLAREHLRGREHADFSDLRAALDPLVAREAAETLAISYTCQRAGEESTSLSVEELTYPVEFDPPAGPQELIGPVDPKTRILTPIWGSAFESRNVGHTTVAGLTWTPDEVIQITVATELVKLAGWDRIAENESQLTQPLFQTMKISNLTISGTSGKPILLGVLSPDSHQGKSTRRVLVFVRPDLLAHPAHQPNKITH